MCLLAKHWIEVARLGRVEVLREHFTLVFPLLVVRLNEKLPIPSYPVDEKGQKRYHTLRK